MLLRSKLKTPSLENHVPPPKTEARFVFNDPENVEEGEVSGKSARCAMEEDGDYCDYDSSEEDPESKVDIYYELLKAEPEPELDTTDGSSDDDGAGGRTYGYDCSHCRISLSTEEFKAEHELRCKVRMEQKKLESQVTKLYHCSYCRCPFLSEEYREQHQRRYCPKMRAANKKPSNGPYLGCDKCKFVTKWKDSLARHVLNHNKNKSEWFTCAHCSYKTVHKTEINRHMKIHNNTFSCCCPICGKTFRNKSGLDNHLLNQHPNESEEVSKLVSCKIYTCDICDRFRTTVKSSFNRHLTMKHIKDVGGQKYECPRCPYSTIYKYSLTKHSKMHAGQKDYQCTVCKKQFTTKLSLQSHILGIHDDNVDLVKTVTLKMHHCESCSYKTLKKDHLNSHVRSKHV